MTFGSLFAGVGGFDLGFELAGMACSWQVECHPFCRRVLDRHWPKVPKHDDVRTFAAEYDESLQVDVICGGFPCQDISDSGRRAGINGARSGLWGEFSRIVRTLRPKYVVVENVAALLRRGFERVLGDLATIGYDAEWEVLPAGAFGAMHIRERVFVVAYPQSDRRNRILQGFTGYRGSEIRQKRRTRGPTALDSMRRLVRECEGSFGEPAILGSDDGIPDGVDRIASCGNAVFVPIAEWIGRRIVEDETKT